MASIINLDGYYANEDDSIGCGAFGVVFKGRDAEETMDVAIKRITIGQLEEKYLEREQSILEGIIHKHIVRLYHSQRSRTYLYLVMEFCEGGHIGIYIEKNGALQRKTSLGFMQSIAEAVEYLHSRTPNIVHRDLKPENVLIQIEGGVPTIKLADFGLARPISAAESRLQMTFGGTFNYMAPECFPDEKGIVEYSLPVDVFAMGLIFLVLHYHVQTRKPLRPIKGKNL